MGISGLRVWVFLIALVGQTLLASAETLPEPSSLAPPTSLAPIVERALPSVVSIAVTGLSQVNTTPLLADPFFRQFFDDFGPIESEEIPFHAAGSGVIIDASEGLLLTNAHVVANARQITVRLMDGRKVEAKIVGADPDTDVAVLRIAPDGLVGISIGQSSALRVGDYVLAIGNPFGLEQTVTLGIVSALGRSGLGIDGYENFIQTDASINPGNSGGALVNMAGELVGINTAILTPSQGSAGIGFAIPVDMAVSIVQRLVREGQVRHGQLGVIVLNITPDLARGLDLDPPSGVLIMQVLPGSAAEVAGLQPRDVIVAMNGVEAANLAALRSQIELLPPGEMVSLEVVRDGKQITVSAVLDETDAEPSETQRQSSGQHHTMRDEAAVLPRLRGLSLVEDSSGLLVTEVAPDSHAARAGLMPGDHILTVGTAAVERVGQFQDAITSARPSDLVLIEVERDGRPLLLVLP